MKTKFRFPFSLFLLLLLPGCMSSSNADSQTREKIICKSHLSPGWYPQKKRFLNHDLDVYLRTAKEEFGVPVKPDTIKAIIAPHAGMEYSGFCAAAAYQPLLEKSFEKNKHITQVIILAPSHAKSFRGVCLPDYDVYQTPLGDITVDEKALQTLGKASKDKLFVFVPKAHAEEHAIEIQLPFLQKTIKDFSIVPLIVGDFSDEECSTICDTLKDIIDDNTLLVISSDFTHHGARYRYDVFKDDVLDNVRFMDSVVLQSIILQSYDDFSDFMTQKQSTVCGRNPIKILLKLIEQNVLGDVQTRVACYYASPQIEKAFDDDDTALDTKVLLGNISGSECENSVSYLGLLLTTEKLFELPKEDRLTEFEKKSLLTLSRRTIENYFAKDTEKTPEFLLWPLLGEGVRKASGAFVTLNKNGDLRGCIGRIVARKPLYELVQEMSLSAAFHDSRFTPVTKNELSAIDIDITVLTPPRAVRSHEDIQIGTHGIILKKITRGKDWKSAVFLPQVPGSFGWDRKKTLEQLSEKAGIGKDGWKQGCQFEVFEGFEIKEDE